MKSLGTRLLIAAIVLGWSAAASAATTGPDFQWSGTMAAGKKLWISGITGSVTVSRTAGREASVTAEKSGKSKHFDEVRVEVAPGPQGVTICALYPGRHGKMMSCRPGKGGTGDVEEADVEVHFTVKLPDGVDIEVEQVNGDIEALDLHSDVSVETVNGSIRASTTELIEASTVNGSITAAMGRGTWDRPLKFASVNGSVKINLPRELNAELHAESVNGGIRSDFPVTQEAGFWKGGEVNGRVGKGGGRLTVQTVNGSIVLSSAQDGARGRGKL
jgi:hypothetical protein